MSAPLMKILGDFTGLWRICSASVAMRWLCQVAINARDVIARRDLQPADAGMGPGPFTVTLKRYGAKFCIFGPHAISGIREMYVRDVYLRSGWLRIKDGDTVVDLGANMGNFTNLALAAGPNVRVVAVEPNKELNTIFNKSVRLNAGHAERVQLVRMFLGRPSTGQADLCIDPNYADAPWVDEQGLLEQFGLTRVDFLKCDIEGGEYSLLHPESRLLAITEALAVEVHAFAGDVRAFMSSIAAAGFEIGPTQHDPDGTATFLAKRRRAQIVSHRRVA
jgi:FkbM family methyltransferase